MIDIKNKKKLWNFQEVRHDIWNLDIPAPPILGSITRNNKKVDVVIAVTKLGNTIILDRLTGKPIYDFHLKKAPRSTIPGEKTNFYQPNLKIPEPVAKNIFNLGNLKFINQVNINEIQNINENFLTNNKFWLIASTHNGEENFCLKVHFLLKDKYKKIFTIIMMLMKMMYLNLI